MSTALDSIRGTYHVPVSWLPLWNRKFLVATDGHGLVGLEVTDTGTFPALPLNIHETLARMVTSCEFKNDSLLVSDLLAWCAKTMPIKCPHCEGTKKRTCPDCKGLLSINCDNCDDGECECRCSTKHPCGECDGLGSYPCETCTEGITVCSCAGANLPGQFFGVTLNKILLKKFLDVVPPMATCHYAVTGSLDPVIFRGDAWFAVVMPMRWDTHDEPDEFRPPMNDFDPVL